MDTRERPIPLGALNFGCYMISGGGSNQTGYQCGIDQSLCTGYEQCIHVSRLCDGVSDCINGIDENGCTADVASASLG